MAEAGTSSKKNPPPKSEKLADTLSSLVVFLVALPLCIGIAVACGVSPERGLVTGIVGGIVVGALSGAPLLVSGPAASLIVPVFNLVQSHGVIALAPVVMLAGLWQAIAGLLRLGQWFRAVAPAVIYGMLTGIGVLIFVSQLHVAIDGDPRSSFLQNVLSLPGALAKQLSQGASGAAPLLVGASTIIFLVAWNRFRPQRLKLVPGHLVSLVAVTITTLLLGAEVRFLDISPSFFEGLGPVGFADLRILLEPSVFGLSFVFAFVASAATLLTATAIDKRQSHSQTDYDREMFAQGIGNMFTGSLGGLPMTGVIVRSSVNVDAGARTRMSTMLHGLWLLLFVSVAPQVLELIPRAILGAILVYTGFKLIDVKAIRELYQRGRFELAICLITLFGVVFVDLFVGIVAGFATALAKLIYTFSRLEIRSEARSGSDVHHLHLAGSATFLRLPRLAQVLEAVPPDRQLRVHIDRLDHIDHACLELLSSWQQRRDNDNAPGMVVEWDELADRYRRAVVGTREAKPSKSLLHIVWNEWKRVYRRQASDAAARVVPERWLEDSRVHTQLEAGTLEEVITRAAEMLAPHTDRSEEELVRALLNRAEGHIALGEGVSLPHAPIEGLETPLVALITTAGTLVVDNEDADVFFVLLAPEADPHQHLRTLAHVGRLCHDPELLRRLRGAREPGEVVDALHEAEKTFMDPEPPATGDLHRVLAIIEVTSDASATRLAELIEEGFGRPLSLSIKDGAIFTTLRRVSSARRNNRLLVLPLEMREASVLAALLDEQARLLPTDVVGLHMLRAERLLHTTTGR